MLRRFVVLAIVALIAVFLLFMQNKVAVGSQGLLAYASGELDLVHQDGGAFIFKDVAGNQIAPTDEQKQQFLEIVEIGLGGKPYPVQIDSVKIVDHGTNSKQIIFAWNKSFSRGNNLIIKKLKERILQWQFGRANEERALMFVPLGIDLRGGVEFMCSLYDDELARVEADDQVVDILRTRLESQGLTEPQVTRLTNGDIQVVIPGGGKAEAARTRRVLETTGKLEFREVLEVYGNDRDDGPSNEPGTLIIQDERGKWRFKPGKDQRGAMGQVLLPMKAPRGEEPRAFYLLDIAKITGQDVKGGSRAQTNSGSPAIGIELTATGGAKNYAYTKDIKDRGPHGRSAGGSGRFAICLDGIVYSAPSVQEPSQARSRITGVFTQQEVDSVVLVLNTGALSVKPEVSSERVIGATLGQDTIHKALFAMIGALFITLSFIVVYYKRLGFVALTSLVVTLGLVWTAISIFGTTMTLPGLAGLVLTIGMAVDANILIFERIREELGGDIDLKTSIDAGYARAFTTIFDANVTTFLTAFVLSQIGTGAVRGFGMTLMIGIVASMFGAIYVGRLITDVLYQKKTEATISNGISKLPINLPYVKLRFMSMIVSSLVIIVGLSYFISGGVKHFAMDFTGGNSVQVTFTDEKSLDEIESYLATAEKDHGEAVSMLAEDLQIQPYFPDFAAAGAQSRQFVFKARDDEAIKIDVQKHELETTYLALLAEKRDRINVGVDLNAPEIKEIDKKAKVMRGDLQPYYDQLAARIDIFKQQLRLTFPDLIPAVGSQILAASFKDNVATLNLEFLSISTADQQTQIVNGINGYPGYEAASFEQGTMHARLSVVHSLGVLVSPISAQERERRLAQEPILAIMYKGLTHADDAMRFAQAEALLHFYERAVQKTASSNLQIAAPFPSSDHFSPQVAEQMKENAYYAIGFSLLVILFYIAMRFELRYGLGAIIALIHDVLATVGIIALLGVRIDLTVVAAILTIIGYSLNDTIVVFDRIRENIKKFALPMRDTIDGAIAQTMSRTILTSCTTIFVVVILLMFGGEGVRAFSLTMLVGLILGTYSSIFVAAPALLFFKDPELETDTDDVIMDGKVSEIVPE